MALDKLSSSKTRQKGLQIILPTNACLRHLFSFPRGATKCNLVTTTRRRRATLLSCQLPPVVGSKNCSFHLNMSILELYVQVLYRPDNFVVVIDKNHQRQKPWHNHNDSIASNMQIQLNLNCFFVVFWRFDKAHFYWVQLILNSQSINTWLLINGMTRKEQELGSPCIS